MPSRSRSRSPHYGEIRSYDRRRRSRSPDRKPGNTPLLVVPLQSIACGHGCLSLNTIELVVEVTQDRQNDDQGLRDTEVVLVLLVEDTEKDQGHDQDLHGVRKEVGHVLLDHDVIRILDPTIMTSPNRPGEIVVYVSLEGLDEEEKMMKLMGFSGFDSTKGKHVDGTNNAEGTRIQQKRRYRQYMNRRGGFNRPLDFIA
ncbi:U4/U6.U5 small nuclear ribonucleoprotein 27 kDa protein [Trichoplax sp. H2]|nr:U4/U6.U5 small nuclear ribonucleoprotein 27 kDa protein [Trichoplax sp. H2]|eukprot:RDD40538.1 U4/U6.U5 small nuclear ribonucleoprotein 27 kDa protein [Trichoplax sp. H2]